MTHLRLLARFCLSRYRHLLSASVDNELTPADNVAVRAHVEECSRCKTEIGKLQFTRNAIRSLEVPLTDHSYPGLEKLLRRNNRREISVETPTSFIPSSRRYQIPRFMFATTATIGGLLLLVVTWGVYSSLTRRQTPAAAPVEALNTSANPSSTKTPESASIFESAGNNIPSRKRLLPPTSPPRAGGELRTSAEPPQQLNLPDSVAVVRGSENSYTSSNTTPFTIFRLRFKATPINIDLPEHSKKGKYVVSITTLAYFEPIKQGSVESNGRRLFIKLPLQDVQPGNYMLLIARKDLSGDEYIGDYPVVITDPTPQNEGATK